MLEKDARLRFDIREVDNEIKRINLRTKNIHEGKFQLLKFRIRNFKKL